MIYSKRDLSLLGISSRTSHGGGSLMTAEEQWIQSAGDTCRLVFWPQLHKDVCVYQLVRVPPLRFQHKNGLQYKFLLSVPPPWRLWHWWGVQSAENLKTQAGILALCTTGYWEESQHKLLWILCRIVAKSQHLAGSGLVSRQNSHSSCSRSQNDCVHSSTSSFLFSDAFA